MLFVCVWGVIWLFLVFFLQNHKYLFPLILLRFADTQDRDLLFQCSCTAASQKVHLLSVPSDVNVSSVSRCPCSVPGVGLDDSKEVPSNTNYSVLNHPSVNAPGTCHTTSDILLKASITNTPLSVHVYIAPFSSHFWDQKWRETLLKNIPFPLFNKKATSQNNVMLASHRSLLN